MKIITFGNELLRKKSIIVNDINGNIINFINEMFKIMYTNKGIGLAAVQVGEIKRIFITHIPDDKPRIFINPDIIITSIDQSSFEEGCLSIPGITGDVIRPYGIKIQAWNEKGKLFSLSAEDLLATVIQHELDHLNGKLFIDHLNSKKKERLLKNYKPKVDT